MPVCKQCGNRVAELIGKNPIVEHLRANCPMPARLLRDDWRPLPLTHTMPPEVPLHLAISGVPYEGEPRAVVPLLAAPERQAWVPLWADLVTDLWARWVEAAPTIFERESRREQRDSVLRMLAASSLLANTAIACWRAEGVSGFRAYLKVHIVGPMPPVLSPEVIRG